MLQNSLPSPNYTVRIQCLLPSNSSQPSSLIVTPDNSNPVMATTGGNLSSSSHGFVASITPTSQATCNICKRLLYPFEEILMCRDCHGSYHWRCIKPDTISHYGENENYICEKCCDGPSHRISNGGIKIKSSDSTKIDYRDFANVPTKLNSTSSTDTTVVNTIRYFEGKQQQQRQQSPIHKTVKVAGLDGYLPSETNGNIYHYRNDQYDNDSRTTQRIQQQQQQQHHHQQRYEIESDGENDTSEMFQANYQYTPLKEFAATRTGRPTNDTNPISYQNSPSGNSDRPTTTSRYGGGLHYSNHGYDPTVSRLVETPSSSSTNFTSPTVDNLSLHNRQHHFISTTNLNVTEKPARYQQANDPKQSFVHSTPYLSQVRDTDSSVYKSLSQQQQIDRYSNVGSDSGIVMVNSNSQVQTDENPINEKKLTHLVQQLGKQLETDAQKINEKLELKLKNLENMIHQQTYIIRRQDEVIERLKSKILKIETERDHFRDQLTIREKHQQSNRRDSNASSTTTENSKPSIKKIPAPRVDREWPTDNNENESIIAKLVKSIPGDRERLASEPSSAPSIVATLISSVPLMEPPAAASRLDNMIHQSTTKDIANPSSSNYSLAKVRHQDRPQPVEPISMEQQRVVTSVHHVDDDDDDDDNNEKEILRRNRISSSSSSSLSVPPVQPSKPINSTLNNNTTTMNRNPNIHRSLESLQQTYEPDQGLRPTHKTTSLEFGTKPVRDDELGSIYILPVEANQPAIQSNSAVKGWLRKQNRDSYFKRVERYYCVLTNNALLMHRHEQDRTPQKAINLKGAKVHYYNDPKYGPSLELNWSSRTNYPKHYHLYAPNSNDATQWVDGIQSTIHNLENNKTNWQQYRMNT